jgi:hypothetical protein
LKQKLIVYRFERGYSLFLKLKHTIFSFEMGKHAASTDSKMLDRIRQRGPGWVFTPSDFSDLGSRVAVALALSRHKLAGTIRQLSRGLYDYAKRDPQLGLLAPTTDAVVAALKGRDAIRLQPSGAYAANLLGLSDQVPMKLVFLTDGPNRLVDLGKQTIQLKRTTPRHMATAGKTSGLVIQALRHLGQAQVNDTVVDQLRTRLTDDDKVQLIQDLAYAPAWMKPILRRVAQTPVIAA